MSLEGRAHHPTPSLSTPRQLQQVPADFESGCEPLIQPVFLPTVGHGPQRGVSCWQAPPEEDSVMQTVGLALPELHHSRVQDVATPSRRSSGFGALCNFPAGHRPHPRRPHPSSSQGPLMEDGRMNLMMFGWWGGGE